MRRFFAFALLARAGRGVRQERAAVDRVGQAGRRTGSTALKTPTRRRASGRSRRSAHVGKADPAAIPALAGALKDRDARVRAEAVLALLNVGPAAKEAVPALEEACRDKDATVRTYAEQALVKVRGG